MSQQGSETPVSEASSGARPPDIAVTAQNLPRASMGERARRVARLISPPSLWPGAIVQKEMRVQGRRYFMYLARGVTALILAGVTVLIFMAMIGNIYGGDSVGGASMRLQELQALAPAVSVAVFVVQLVGMSLAGPILLGPSLCDERRAGTLSTLLTTPLTAWQIVLGKMLSAFSQLSILALIPLPLVLAVRVFGGVPAEFVFAGLSVSFAMAFLGASLAVFFSTGVRRGLTASILAMMTAIALNSIPSLVAQSLIRQNVPLPLGLPLILSSPATAVFLVADLIGGGPGGTVGTRTLWVWNSLTNAGVGALMLLIATAKVRALLRKEGAGAPATSKRGTGKRRAPGRPRAGSREVGAHPVMWRELRQRMFKRAFWLVLSLLAAASFLVLSNWDTTSTRAPTMIITVLGTSLSLLLASAGSAGSVNGEREARTWDVLLTTGLSARQIVLGKFAGSMRRQLFVPGVVLVQQAYSALSGDLRWPGILMQWVILLPSIAFLSATGLWMSMVFRRATTAAVFNLLFALGLWAAGPALAGIATLFFERVRLEGVGHGIMSVVLVLNPVFMAGSNVDGFAVTHAGGGRFSLGTGPSVGVGVWAAVTAIATCGIYLLATAGVLAWIVRRFNKLAGRAA